MKQLCALLLCSWLAVPAAAQPAPDARTGSIGGRVLRPDGIPQPEAEVRGRHARTPTGSLRHLPWRTRTAFDGRYDITGVPAGRYLVLVRIVGGDSPMAGRPLATLFPGVSRHRARHRGRGLPWRARRGRGHLAAALAAPVSGGGPRGRSSGPAARARVARVRAAARPRRQRLDGHRSWRPVHAERRAAGPTRAARARRRARRVR